MATFILRWFASIPFQFLLQCTGRIQEGKYEIQLQYFPLLYSTFLLFASTLYRSYTRTCCRPLQIFQKRTCTCRRSSISQRLAATSTTTVAVLQQQCYLIQWRLYLQLTVATSTSNYQYLVLVLYYYTAQAVGPVVRTHSPTAPTVLYHYYSTVLLPATAFFALLLLLTVLQLRTTTPVVVLVVLGVVGRVLLQSTVGVVLLHCCLPRITPPACLVCCLLVLEMHNARSCFCGWCVKLVVRTAAARPWYQQQLAPLPRRYQYVLVVVTATNIWSW